MKDLRFTIYDLRLGRKLSAINHQPSAEPKAAGAKTTQLDSKELDKSKRKGFYSSFILHPSSFKLDWVLVAILALSVALRLLVWLIAPHPGFVIDEAEYYQISSVLAGGRGWSFYEDATWVRPPLYILMLAGVFKFFGPNLIIIRLIQIIFSVASVYLLYLLGKRVYGRKTGLWAAGLAAVSWPFVVFPYLLLSETLFILLFLASVLCFTEFIHLRFTIYDLRLKNQISGDRLQVSEKPRRFPFIPHPSSLIPLLAGSFLLGLAALTRGQVVSFVPFIFVWFWVALRQFKTALIAFVVVAVVFAVTVSPWALRNASVYGRPFIDNTGGYNFYLGALKGRNGALVSQTLEAVKNQADRESLGYTKGLQIFWKDPASFIFDKGVKESLDFWQINFGADERLLEAYTTGVVNSTWLIFDAVLNDLFYIVTGALALLGIVVAPRTSRGARSFVAIWTLQNMLLAFTFFAVTRFRLSVHFFLLLFAAYALAHWREIFGFFNAKNFSTQGRRDAEGTLGIFNAKMQRREGTQRGFQFKTQNLCDTRMGAKLKTISAVLLPVLFLAVVLPSYAPGETMKGIERWNAQQHAREGDRLRLTGQYEAALAEYAQAAPTVPATQIGIGLTEALQGRYDEAIGRIGRTNQDIAASHLALGAVYLLQGNTSYARSEFRTRQVALDPTADEWAWDNFPVRPLADNTLKLGDYDWGYVRGFQYYETDPQTGAAFRWTAGRGDDGQGRAAIRFPNGASAKPQTLNLKLRGLRPDPLSSPAVQVWANGRSIGTIQTSRDWQTYSLKLPAALSGDVIIELGAPTFVPGAASRRGLGVMVEQVSLK